MQATTQSPLHSDADTIVVGLLEGERVAHDLPSKTLGALLEVGEARTELGHLAVAHGQGRRFVLVGLGARTQFDSERARVAAAKAHGRAAELGARTLCWELPHRVPDAVAAALVQGTMLHAYRYERYRPKAERPAVERLIVSAHDDVSEAVAAATIVGTAQNRARDLVNAPANELTPPALAQSAEASAERLPHLSARILDEEEIRAAGMGAFAAVARGSAEPARLIELRLQGPAARGLLVACLGELVCCLGVVVALVRAGVPRVPFPALPAQRRLAGVGLLAKAALLGERVAFALARRGDLRLQRPTTLAQAREPAHAGELARELLAARLGEPHVLGPTLRAGPRELGALIARLAGQHRGGLRAGDAGLLELRACLIALGAGLGELAATRRFSRRRRRRRRVALGRRFTLGLALVRERDRDRRKLEL